MLHTDDPPHPKGVLIETNRENPVFSIDGSHNMHKCMVRRERDSAYKGE
jgi:hypothetical protein